MKYIKRLGYLLAALLVLIVAAGIIMPKEIKVTVEKEMETPVSVAYNIANNFLTQEEWNPWMMGDETMQIEMGSLIEGKGASYSWTSENSGAGTQTITETSENEKITIDVDFDDQGHSLSSMLFSKTEEGSMVSWAFESKTGFPSNILAPFYKYSVKKAFKKGLKNLEGLAEKRWKEGIYFGHKINLQDLPERNFIMSRDNISVKDIKQFYISNLGSLFNAVQKAGVEMDGMPSGLFFDFDEQKGMTDMGAAIPVADRIKIENTISLNIPEGPGLVIDHYGDYAGLTKTHHAMVAYMRDRGLINNAPVVEEYLSDPEQEKDPSKVLTKVYYYLADTGK